MNENLIDKIASESNFNSLMCTPNKNEIPLPYHDDDSDSSFYNLLDPELSDKTPEGTPSPYYTPIEPIYHNLMCHSKPLAIPDIKSETTDQLFEDLLMSNLPQIIATEKASIQYEVLDQNFPRLSKSFKNGFNSPVLDLLVVVLNDEKLVSFYRGYFAGIPRLAHELINLKSKYWKSLISNNDENAWENHFRSVSDKFNSPETNELEFEIGPVIRCRLRASDKQQYNQQYNYFFVQPCSYMVQLSLSSPPGREFNFNDVDGNMNKIYMVSYINIMRECDTEYALKGSAAASLQKVITNSTTLHRPNLDTPIENPIGKTPGNRYRKNATTNSNQLSVEISSPTYTNPDIICAPLTYPLVNEHQQNKQRVQMQRQVNQHRQQHPLPTNQIMSRVVPMNIMDSNQHQYQNHYQGPQSTSKLQYILENRNSHYPNTKPIHSAPHQMASQLRQGTYHNTGRPNVPCYLPTDHGQSTSSNCSLSSPTSFLPTRHLVPMSSNGIILSSEQYYRNVIDSSQVVQPMMGIVRSLPSGPNHGSNAYYCSTAQSQHQQQQTPIHVINSLPHQTTFSASSLPQYCSNQSEMMFMSSQPYETNRIANKMPIKSESYDMTPIKDWNTNKIMDNSVATTYCGSLNSLPMTHDSISFDIVEEILKAEEEKSENKRQAQSLSNSDNSDPLSFDLDDFVSIDPSSRHQPINNIAPPMTSDVLFTYFDGNNVDNKHGTQSSGSNDALFNLRSETMEKFTNAQRIAIKNLVNQRKEGKIDNKQMLQQINDFVSSTLGKSNHNRRIVELWKTQHPGVDSTLSNLNCSHVVQSPEEGPGISPTEHAAQSTTDIEDDKDLGSRVFKQVAKKGKEDYIYDLGRRRVKSKSSSKGFDASIYSITSTTPTCVLETLLNEHDNPINSDKNYGNQNTKLSISLTPKNQLSLDQLLMDDDCSMLVGFNPRSEVSKKTCGNVVHQRSPVTKSQPSTPCLSGNMGVLESLLNQKNPSMYCIRQKSTESILKHSKPSRLNSIDSFHEDIPTGSDGNEMDNGLKKNSLLITLLNNSSGNSSADKYRMVNSSATSSIETPFSVSQPKRQRMFSGANESPNDSNSASKKPMEKTSSSGIDVFDFVACELNGNNSEFQSGTVTSSQQLNSQKTQQNKRSRKRCYSKEMSLDSDGGSDKTTSKSSFDNSQSNDKKGMLNTFTDNRKIDENSVTITTADLFLSLGNRDGNFGHPSTVYEENIDFEDIKIDDFDLEHLIDISEQLENSRVGDPRAIAQPVQVAHDSGMFRDSFSAGNYDISTIMPPVVNIRQSDPIVPVSKQSVIRVSDKNSILFSAIQSTSTMSTNTIECLDNERERLLKQQQHQKLCIGGKYKPLNPIGVTDVDYQHSLDLLSKQMKEVGPNVMVEPSNNVENIGPRKTSFSRIPPVMSPINTTLPSQSLVPTSPITRSSSVSTDIQGDHNKMSTVISSHVNHQQVREGLRLLVSSRSAQNNSKNNVNSQRTCAPNLNELMSPGADFIVARTPGSKSMIHYHSDSQGSNQTSELSVTELHPAVANATDSKITNILEDSLVNDVFGLEELVNSKSSNPILENLSYQSVNLPQGPPDLSVNGDAQMMSVSSDLGPSQSTSLQTGARQPHHHHHLPHYHYPHHHHHHHTVPAVSQSNTDSTIPQSKEKQPVNAGLLETLLSR